MIEIERLTLKLPAGFEARARGIAFEFAKILPEFMDSDGPTFVDRVDLPRVRVDSSMGDGEIAARLAREVSGAFAAAKGRR